VATTLVTPSAVVCRALSDAPAASEAGSVLCYKRRRCIEEYINIFCVCIASKSAITFHLQKRSKASASLIHAVSAVASRPGA
jgi:hypothetical protein